MELENKEAKYSQLQKKFQRDSTEIVFQCFNVLCVFKTKKKKKTGEEFKLTNYYTINQLKGRKKKSNEKAS